MTFNAREISDSESIEAYAESSRILRGIRWFDLGIVLPLAAVGVWLTRARWRELSLLYGFFAAHAL